MINLYKLIKVTYNQEYKNNNVLLIIKINYNYDFTSKINFKGSFIIMIQK
jgi:hypothetical protein